MSFSSENGYLPASFDSIMERMRLEVNAQYGTSWTAENFVGSNWYKLLYAPAQEMHLDEVKTAEIFLKLQQYFAVTNETIQRPVATAPGIIEALEREGWVASLKAPLDADAGKLYLAVDVDNTLPNYADLKLEINTLISESVAAGIVTQGDQVNTIVLSNGQPFDFKFKRPNYITPKLRLTLTLSDNNQEVVGDPDDVKSLLISNIMARYRLGRDFEPQKYFTTTDAPWTSQVLLEYSLDDGATWLSVIYEANYDDLFKILLANITIVEN